jgi:tol-pal system protein YbgF
MNVALKSFVGPVAIAAAIMVASTLPADAQRRAGDVSERQLIEAVRQLQQDVSDLERYIYNAPQDSLAQDSAPATSSSDMLPATAILSQRVDNLEISVRNLTGQVEQLNFRVNQLSQRMETVIADMDLRLRALEGSGGGSSTYSSTFAPDTGPQEMNIASAPIETGDVGAAPIQGPGAPQSLGVVSANSLAGSEDADFEIGMQLLRQGDFQGAQTTFEDFIASYPESERLGEANFWLGESLYVRNQFADAATAYLASARDHADGEKAPDSLLKLGMSLAALGQIDQACSAFDQVARSYPNASERVTRNVARERTANNCT